MPTARRSSLASLSVIPESRDLDILTSDEVELLRNDARVRWPPASRHPSYDHPSLNSHSRELISL